MKKIIAFFSVSILLLTSIYLLKNKIDSKNTNYAKRNAILLIPDGYGPTTITMTRLTTKEKSLNIDPFQKGSTRTYSHDSWVTDSASSATAYSCGIKTYNGAIGVNPNRQPCKTILESAKAQGYKVGLVVTSYITHATPAAFSSHVVDRNMYTEIASQQITKSIDVLLGGGLKYFLPVSEGGERRDGRNLITEAKEKYGYNFIDKREELNTPNLPKLPLLGLFDHDHIPYEIDRKWKIYEEVLKQKVASPPTLTEMSKVAIELLKKSCDSDPSCPGFFLMIEGSRIDHGGHANDPGAAVAEALEFDRAFGLVIDNARRFQDILVVSVADHATGSLTLGDSDPKTMYSWDPEQINKQQISLESLLVLLRSGQTTIVDAYKKYMNIDDLKESEIQDIQNAVNRKAYHLLGIPTTTRAKIYFKTTGHDGVDVPHYAYGPGSDSFKGNIENINIAHGIVKHLRLKGVGGPLNK